MSSWAFFSYNKNNVFKNEKISYNDIAVLTQNTEGKIISLEVDSYKINYLKSLISNEI